MLLYILLCSLFNALFYYIIYINRNPLEVYKRNDACFNNNLNLIYIFIKYFMYLYYY